MISIIFLCLASCSSKQTFISDIIPVESYSTRIIDERCSKIISSTFEITVESIKNIDWKQIFKYSNFSSSIDISTWRPPKLLFFQITIENTSDIPLEIENIFLNFGTIKSEKLNSEEITAKYNSSVYSIFNFDNILNFSKLDSDESCINDIEYNKNLSSYHEQYIKSGEKVLQIIAFNIIPVQIRNFNVSLNIKSDIIQKVIDFKFMKFEYRQSGNHFVKPVITND